MHPLKTPPSLLSNNRIYYTTIHYIDSSDICQCNCNSICSLYISSKLQKPFKNLLFHLHHLSTCMGAACKEFAVLRDWDTSQQVEKTPLPKKSETMFFAGGAPYALLATFANRVIWSAICIACHFYLQPNPSYQVSFFSAQINTQIRSN